MEILMKEGLKSILERHNKYLSEFLKGGNKIDTFQYKEFERIIEDNKLIMREFNQYL